MKREKPETTKLAKWGKQVPVTIITGFLGAGKTTVINHLVKQPGMTDTALIINEFGEIGLDNLLIESAIENTLVLENGCICCSIRGDLIDTINDLFIKQQNDLIPKFSRILIETTGLAQPGPIAETLWTEKIIANRCALKNIVTLVDGQQGLSQIDRYHEVVAQLAQAECALISKSDISEEETLEALEKRITAINPVIAVQRISNGEIDPNVLFRSENNFNQKTPAHHHHEDHDLTQVATWSFNSQKPLDHLRLMDWLSMLYTLRPYAMLRMKGILKLEGQDQPVLMQAVGTSFSPSEQLQSWPGGNEETNLVLIFRDISSSDIELSFRLHVLQ
jgi:G3E family GTPase